MANFPEGPKSSPGERSAVVADRSGKPAVFSGKIAADPVAPPDDGSAKMSAERALVSGANDNCGNCTHWDEQSGDCEKVEGTYTAEDRCYAAFWPKDGGQTDEYEQEAPAEPDADDAA